MTGECRILAVDLGAESGRGMLGSFDGSRLSLQEIHRFPNIPVPVLDALHWDALRLHNDIRTTLRKAASERIQSVGVCTWGVDFALLGRDGSLLGNPRHYRDPHTEGIMEAAFARVPQADIYRHTGLQFLRFNSLFQLLALHRDRSPLLDLAETLLFMPDLFHYWLSGIKVNERTDASTSQLLDATTQQWALPLIQAFGLPHRMLGSLVPPGTVLGPLRTSVARDADCLPVPVIAPATHDTAAAVAAVPMNPATSCYISSGTWSLMGAEVSAPLVTIEAMQAGFTNEGGVGGTTRFLRNIMGLWLVQECRRAWERTGREFTYEQLTTMAEAAPPFAAVIDPDDASFLLPTSMPEAITAFCRKTGQTPPSEPGAVVRCCLESLALRYRWVLSQLETLLGRRLDTIHIVGGGSQNRFLCQLTADCCDRLVIAGPVEGTALGNVLTQLMGLKHVNSLDEGREIVRRSFSLDRYEPRQPQHWAEAQSRFERILVS